MQQWGQQPGKLVGTSPVGQGLAHEKETVCVIRLSKQLLGVSVYVPVTINDMAAKFLIDTGSGATILSTSTVQITFIFIGQTHLVFGKRVCTCVTKHSNAFRTFLNWLKNSKRVWHERKLHIMCVPLFANFDQ